MQQKPIFIIDCFVQSFELEQKLISCLDRLKEVGADTMLITNTAVDKQITARCNYVVYDSENRLFEEMQADDIILYKLYDNLEIHEIVSGVQKHGLSVVRNLSKAARIAEIYGYTHFHRIEVDDLMGPESVASMLRVPSIVEMEGKSGLFFFNQNDISFHYMYCSIETYLRDIPQIETQEDYTDYLRDRMRSESYKNVEDFFKHALESSNSDVVKIDGQEMNTFFPDTTWNTETSQSNLPGKHRGCTTGFYRTIRGESETGDWTVLSYNYTDREVHREISTQMPDGSILRFSHSLYGKGFWQYNIVPNSAVQISVYEKGELIYTCSPIGTKSYVVIK